MLTLFLLLAAAGGVLRLALQWGVQRRWGITIGLLLPDLLVRRG